MVTSTAHHKKFSDPVKVDDKHVTLVELRSGEGKQTVIPPSSYTVNGKTEQLAWVTPRGKAVEVNAKELERAVAMLAAAALSGGMLRGGWALDQVQNFIYAVCAAARDEERDKRVEAARQTKSKMDSEQHDLSREMV